jgi:hypothetical protein
MLNGFQLNSTALNASSGLNYIQAEAVLGVVTSVSITGNYIFKTEASWNPVVTTDFDAFQYKYVNAAVTAKTITLIRPYQIWAGSTAWEGKATTEPFDYLPVTNGEANWVTSSFFEGVPESAYGDIDWVVTATITTDAKVITPVRAYWQLDGIFTADTTMYLTGAVSETVKAKLLLSPNVSGDSGTVKYAVTNWSATAVVEPIDGHISLKTGVWYATTQWTADTNIIKPAYVTTASEATVTIGSDRYRMAATEWIAEATLGINSFTWLRETSWEAKATPRNFKPYLIHGAETKAWAFGFAWGGESGQVIRGATQKVFVTSSLTIDGVVIVPAQTDWAAETTIIANSIRTIQAELDAVAISTKFVGGAILSKLPAPLQRTFYVKSYISDFYVPAITTEFKEAA